MLSDNAMCVLTAIKLGCSISSIPSTIYDELAGAGLICASVPCLPDVCLTDAGAELVSDVEYASGETGVVPFGHFRDVSRPCPVSDRQSL